jgi:hypothetical protein
MQSNDSSFAVCDGLDQNTGRVIYQSVRYLCYKVCHVLYRVFPCRKLRRLSHHTPSDSGVTKKRSRLSLCLVYCEIFQESAGTSETPVAVSPGIIPNRCFTKSNY